MSDRAKEAAVKNSIAFRKRQKTYAAFGGVKPYLEAMYGQNERTAPSGGPGAVRFASNASFAGGVKERAGD
jgi:hypothetical protein